MSNKSRTEEKFSKIPRMEVVALDPKVVPIDFVAVSRSVDAVQAVANTLDRVGYENISNLAVVITSRDGEVYHLWANDKDAFVMDSAIGMLQREFQKATILME